METFSYHFYLSLIFEGMLETRCCIRPHGGLNSFECYHSTLWSVELYHTIVIVRFLENIRHHLLKTYISLN